MYSQTAPWMHEPRTNMRWSIKCSVLRLAMLPSQFVVCPVRRRHATKNSCVLRWLQWVPAQTVYGGQSRGCRGWCADVRLDSDADEEAASSSVSWPSGCRSAPVSGSSPLLDSDEDDDEDEDETVTGFDALPG